MSSADSKIPSYVRFAIAGLAGGGASFASHPFDLVKYRMQLSGKGSKQRLHKSSVHAVIHVASNEGYLAVYNGLSASILRQLTLTMTRMGLYSVIVDKYTAEDGTPPPLSLQLFAGMVSGALGAIIGNPADVALVRMSSDGSLHPEKRYNYKHAFDAIATITRKEGLSALWIGWKPAVFRTVVLNITQIVLYKNTKVLLLKSGHFDNNLSLQVICSIWTALVSSIATAPIDITKTRIMFMKSEAAPEYSNMIDVWLKIIKHEGFFSLWKGLTPTFARILPNNFVVFIILEFLTNTYKSVILGDKSGSGF